MFVLFPCETSTSKCYIWGLWIWKWMVNTWSQQTSLSLTSQNRKHILIEFSLLRSRKGEESFISLPNYNVTSQVNIREL